MLKYTNTESIIITAHQIQKKKMLMIYASKSHSPSTPKVTYIDTICATRINRQWKGLHTRSS